MRNPAHLVENLCSAHTRAGLATLKGRERREDHEDHEEGLPALVLRPLRCSHQFQPLEILFHGRRNRK